MATLTTTPVETYLADYSALERSASRDGAAWLAPLRAGAWSRFAELGLPVARRGNERWKYTNIEPLAKTPFRLAQPSDAGPDAAIIESRAPWDDAWTTLVFVDGRFSPRLSRLKDSNITAGDLASAAAGERALVEQHLTRVQSFDEEHFTLLNTAFLADGACVCLPDNAAPAQPIHLLFVSTPSTAPRVTHPRALVIAGKHARATVVESYVSLDDSDTHFSNAVAEFHLDEGARIEHYRVLLENEKSFHIGNTRVYQHANSGLNSVAFATGPAIGRNDIHVLVDGEGAECNLVGLYMTANSQHMDNNISVTHEKPRGTSHQYYKGILAGKSRAVFSGIVVVKPGAIKTYADQKDMNLLLSPGAEVDTKPSLEIFADDVKCYHGATAGHVDEDTLYYMRSRGIDFETASRMLIRGFASEVVERVNPPALARHIEDVMERMLPGFKFEGLR
ncbi:MAG: Fe-S cluster assembly protein SufD [Chloroflexi bacterium]|nr:Fe-S cluster assembly protein SufD [Chloroflexota bacterium]